jgi:beta-1,4-mannosyltransferase
MFSSGALLLALSYGLPVVAPDSAVVREVVQRPALEPFAPGHLTDALRAMRSEDMAKRRSAALRATVHCTYEAMAATVVDAYLGTGGDVFSPEPR